MDIDVVKRKNRRRMAWVALFSILAVTIMAFFYVDVERLKVLGEVITWFYFVMGSIVGAYVGFSSVFDFKNKELSTKGSKGQERLDKAKEIIEEE